MRIFLQNPEATEEVGAKLSAIMPLQGTVFLHGQLGAGKTTFVRGFLRALGHKGAVKSPTYTLVEEYQFPDFNLFHFDLYRVKGPEELEWMGIQDYFTERSLCFVEWPEMGNGYLPDENVRLKFSVEKQGHVLLLEKMPAEIMAAFEKQ